MNAIPETNSQSSAADRAVPTTPRKSRLWLWVVAVCALQLLAWTAWLTIASKHRVAEVPLESAGGAAR